MNMTKCHAPMRPHKYPMILMEMDRQRKERADIAAAAGVSLATWTNMTRGSSDITVKQAYRVLRYLGLPLDLSKYFPEED